MFNKPTSIMPQLSCRAATALLSALRQGVSRVCVIREKEYFAGEKIIATHSCLQDIFSSILGTNVAPEVRFNSKQNM